MIKNKLIRNIKNKNGNGIIFACVLVLALGMIVTVMLEHSKTYIATKSIRDGMESAVTSIATNNCNKVYSSQREGYFTNYEYDANSWEKSIENTNLDKYLSESLGVKKESNAYVKRNSDGEKEFEITNVKLNVTSPEIAPTDKNKNKETFNVELVGNVKIYKSFASSLSDEEINVTLGAKAGYMPKF